VLDETFSTISALYSDLSTACCKKHYNEACWLMAVHSNLNYNPIVNKNNLIQGIAGCFDYWILKQAKKRNIKNICITSIRNT